MIYLDNKADTCPDGLQGTPFWEVYNALRQVAATGAWPVDPGAYRAGMAWGWYALHKPEYLTNFREVVQAALISACAPMIKPTQTDAELVEYLRQWREYRPTFPQLQSLYSLFGAVVDIQSISDPESQAVLPVDDTRLAFYLRVESVDPERPLSLSDAITIAVRATPIGSRPYAYYVQESRVTVPVALAPAGVTVWVENDTIASDPPTSALPTVTVDTKWVSSDKSVTSLRNTYRVAVFDGNGVHVPYSSQLSYASVKWFASVQDETGNIALNTSLSNFPSYPDYLYLQNNTGNTITIQRIQFAICSDNTAAVITVYDSSNNPYNAFQYTSDGTNYYYVLDGTQTDWTDDLESIGYHLPAQTLELVVFMRDGGVVVNFNANDYWYAVLRSNADEQVLIDFGVEIATSPSGSKIIKTQDSFFYDIIDMYTGDGTGSIPSADLSNFWCSLVDTVGSAYSNALLVKSINAYNSVQSWRVRITKNKDNVSWMMSDQSDVFIGYAGSHQLYDASGNAIPYDSTKTYTIVGYYTDANYVSLDMLTTSNNQYFSFVNYNSSGYLGIKSSNSSTDYRIQRVIYKV